MNLQVSVIFKRNYLLLKTVLLIVVVLFSCKETPEYKAISEENKFISTKEIPDNYFLGDNNCKECHVKEFKEWQGSHHDKAMQLANSLSVLANFDGEKFTSQGVTSHFFKKEKGFFVNTEGPDGNYHDYKIIYTFGVTPLQQYIVKFPNGHFQCLKTAWNTDKKKWFDLYPDFKIVHSEWLHWSRGGLNWNNMCSDCHSTNVRKNYDRATHSYTTKYALINVSCEACHGPGKKHVEDVKRLGQSYSATGTMHMTLRSKPHELVDECARCHMKREQFSENYNFEGTLLDHYFPQLIETPVYHSDGQILDEDYVYGSFIQSKMYQNNVTCNDCHNSHSLKLKFKGNALCTQCHILEKYDTPKHHFHEINTKGAMCVNCHMPGSYYMGNDYRRDHSFRIPRPDLNLKYGTPNACTSCHKDKSNDWVWNEFKNLFGEVDSTHFSDKLAHGITRQPNGDISLLELIEDSNQPEMVRASAVKALSNYDLNNYINQYIALLNDESPLVRATTADVLSEINSPDYLNYFLPLLKDSKRSVRIKAFYGLALLSENQVPELYKNDYQRVKKEFYTYLKINLDFVGGRIQKANYYIKKGNIKKGIKGYEEALEINNTNNQIRLNLANLYYKNGAFKKAEEAFKTIIKQEPKFGPTYYSLALLFIETGKDEEAINQLKKANTIMPNNIRVYYNLGLLYNKIKKESLTEKTFIKGLKIAPNNESLLYALAYHYYKHNQLSKAKNITIKLIQLYPNKSRYVDFLHKLKTKK